jgi:hypothetical protein
MLAILEACYRFAGAAFCRRSLSFRPGGRWFQWQFAQRALGRVEHGERDLAREGMLQAAIGVERSEPAQRGSVFDPDLAQLARARRADILDAHEAIGHDPTIDVRKRS